ncbi:epoxyqueuosine reductase QueH [bacterium]|nr:epoxyqueuosine reductase QueH [bacterium]MBU1652197.1 epoxyqueuosine reductase QueH [bacterium]
MKLLLHVCCGPDVTVALERLPDLSRLALFFDNPNIHPAEEYQKRYEAFRQVAEYFKAEIINSAYDQEVWAEEVKGLEEEPEGGKRCIVCFRYRLRRTAEKAKDLSFDTIGSVLTTSPHKDAELINQTGQAIATEFGLNYLASNFKKQDGFKRSVELSRQIGIYRQNYCGCLYSIDNANKYK